MQQLKPIGAQAQDEGAVDQLVDTERGVLSLSGPSEILDDPWKPVEGSQAVNGPGKHVGVGPTIRRNIFNLTLSPLPIPPLLARNRQIAAELTPFPYKDALMEKTVLRERGRGAAS